MDLYHRMEGNDEDSDLPDRKRQLLSPSRVPPQLRVVHDRRFEVESLDDAIWMRIVEFLPIPTDLSIKEDAASSWHTWYTVYDRTVLEVVTTWRTLLDLRLMSKQLAALLHPVKSTARWRLLVLQSFDFSVNGSFNAENFLEEHEIEEPEEQEHETEASEDKPEENPQFAAMRGRYEDMPAEYLEEDLANWSMLGIYHRPSQYGFLTTLQRQGPSAVEWPESEDPFTLFGDLVRLLMLPHGDRLTTGGEDCDTSFKYLAAPTEAGSESLYYRFFVMKTLGYVPHFWHWGRGIGPAWKGFSEPDALAIAIAKQLEERPEFENEEALIDQSSDFDHEFAFPTCTVRDAKRLFHDIRQGCKDWRSVCCNSGCDGITPVFFVGESNLLPHRWIGYGGGKCWT